MSRDLPIGYEQAGPDTVSGPPVLLVCDGDPKHELPDEPFLTAGFRIERATGLPEALNKCAALRPPFIFMPLTIGGFDTSDILKSCLSKHDSPIIVVIASHDEINIAAEAMRAGAFDCLFRPFSPGRLSKTIAAAVEAAPALAPRPAGAEPVSNPGPAAIVTAPHIDKTPTLERAIVASDDMRDLVARAKKIARAGAPVFITGEVGTGKSLFAEGIHTASPRAQERFETLDGPTQSTGHLDEKASRLDRGGGGGTLVIDEICELETGAQARLLVLMEKWADRRTGPRLIATTRHDPHEAIRDGHLRPALYYRLNVSSLDIPPLRERPEDIELVARTKLIDYARAEGRRITGFSEEALDILLTHEWPGNVRELLNVLWALVFEQTGPTITPAMLPRIITRPRNVNGTPVHIDGERLVGRPLAEIERLVIEATIRSEGGSLPRAANVLGVSPSTLYRKREAWMKTQDI